MTGQDWMDKDFYAVLGITKDAEEAEIKKAYRKMARQLHPDQNQNDQQAEAKFKEVTKAYSVLSDPEQRRQYDALRAMAAGGPRFRASGPGTSGGAGAFEDILNGMFGGHGAPDMHFTSAGASAADFEEMLGMFNNAAAGASAPPRSGSMGGQPLGGAGAGGGFASRMGFGRRAPQRGQDVSASTRLQFHQALHGTTVRLLIEERPLTVRIPPGVRDGQKIRLRGQGRPGVGGADAGDLVVTVRVDPHPVLSLEGKNLHMNVPVSFAEAALGATIEVPLPEGKSVKLRVPKGTANGQILRVAGYGVPTGETAGDLLVHVVIAVPSHLSKEARKAVEAFKVATAAEDPRAGLADRVNR